MPDRRQPDSSTDDNPFAAPPEGRPDQPWEPRGGGGDGDRDRDRLGGEPGAGGPARWDPTDPIQRRARYALLAGMWGFFFGIFGIPSMGLLLGALAVYWGVTALRGQPPAPAPTDGTPPPPSGLAALGPAARPQRTAAISGLATAALAILLAATSYGLQLAYKDFYVCRDDALTRTAEVQCNTLLPDNFVGDILKVQK
ncbi:hypothetical protein MTF65_19555 [Streptomyces sp. APSN-46.1]|uniref:hypothetical protein n=1 Tax=Streptomyces sp. APSN-46.1 TaxID=2929049 RepID=UPI001FB3CF7A|nr:hypothetical protein [Streptomyces sp. APSN-46.1]MCJ1679497.1 hypothetical protein [Streptomyces sp. APSN-46.1]